MRVVVKLTKKQSATDWIRLNKEGGNYPEQSAA